MLRVAQVVAALDAVAALAADDPARGERAKREQAQNRSVDQRVDREAGPDGTEWKGTRSRHPALARRIW